MAKIKLTKGELKRQRDALAQYRRYLPTLQLKKQQLQLEIVHQIAAIERKRHELAGRRADAAAWAGLMHADPARFAAWARPARVDTGSRNIAGVDLPVFRGAIFASVEHDLFETPVWYDAALDLLREIAALEEEARLLFEGLAVLRRELRTTTQRVNLFEKVKIPETEEAIRVIKIFIGDQLANAVGRSKIAKRKLEAIAAEAP